MKPEDFLRTSKKLEENKVDRMKNTIVKLEMMKSRPINSELITEAVLSEKERNELVDEMIEHAERFIRAAKALKNGQPITEAYDEIFFEAKRDEREAISKAGRMMEHLLKLAYSTLPFDNPVLDVWRKDVKKHHASLEDLLLWETKPDKDLIEKTTNNIQIAYNAAIRWYKGASKEYDDLLPGLKRIPDGCPWTLNQLMDNSTEELISILPK